MTKTERKWQSFESECLYCGSDLVEVMTTTGKDNWAEDGDEARCRECGLPGSVTIDEEGLSCANYIQWHDEPDCDCAWCKSHRA
jgi:hypothetical protein